MNYSGPNTNLVNEVLEFALSDLVFGARGPEEDSTGLLIINDMRRAVDAAGGQGPEAFFRAGIVWDNGRRLDGDDLTWHDLCENLIAKYIWRTEWYQWRERNADSQDLLVAYHPYFGEIQRHFATLLPDGPPGPGSLWDPHADRHIGYYRDYIARDATDVFSYIAQNRAYNGMTDNFWEQLFQLYKAGLWPCGWQGSYPDDGRLMVWRRTV
jgi:hypothetical protein